MDRKIVAILLALLLMLCAGQPAFAGPYDPPPAPPVVPPEVKTEISNEVKTEDDAAASKSLSETGTATVDLSTKTDAKAELSTALVDKMVEENLPLTVQNTGVKLELPAAALNQNLVKNNVNNETAKVEIGAKAVTAQEQQEIINKTPVGQSTGIFTVGSVVVNLSAAVVTASGSTQIDSFDEPVAVTIDLSDSVLTDEEISQLTGTRLELDANGNYVTVNLGGTYNPVTKQFTFYTEKFSLYTVMRVENLVNVALQVGVREGSFNGVKKTMDVEPMIINNRTMVPLRYIGEALGATFKWNEKTRTVTFTKDAQDLTLVIDKLQPGLDTPATIQNGRTMVPIRYISESFGAQVTWIPSTKTIQVVK